MAIANEVMFELTDQSRPQQVTINFLCPGSSPPFPNQMIPFATPVSQNLCAYKTDFFFFFLRRLNSLDFCVKAIFCVGPRHEFPGGEGSSVQVGR